MTWVLGWPLRNEDAIEIAKKHNLVKNPKADEHRLAQAAKIWVGDQVGIINAMACWVNDMPELVFAAYVEFGDRSDPPAKVSPANMISDKQFNRLKRAMPLKNFGWYQHNDPYSKLYRNSDNDEDEDSDGSGGESSDEDGDSDESSNEGSDGEERMDTAKDSAGDDSDNETVTDGVVSAVDSVVDEGAQSLSREFHEGCHIDESLA
ncbi:uncharacterized protein C8Q71DRAFT_846366 [Rhodofomes roseus]|uniref:Uncharacterized protein n=1 Tax=Rhodofomes roseus TaxID=34475 RepID=A0ABQ8KPH8_9APHY|nr:uncharacterized protein C8Q71DRAFT_846366 [Rhodofomes roseus]KAH9839752.1 hypothetical protein C8Q71DRAFT_846366 [Rhodofomes roseus]